MSKDEVGDKGKGRKKRKNEENGGKMKGRR